MADHLPTHVVVDPLDGYTWARDEIGYPFVEATARAFCEARNRALIVPRYRLFGVVDLGLVRSQDDHRNRAGGVHHE